MNNFKIKNKLIIPLITILVLIVLFLFLPLNKALIITNVSNTTNRLIFKNAIKERFIISYTHSVNKGRVHNYYRITQDNQIELYKTDFVSYGAGISEPSETKTGTFVINDDSYEIKNLNKKMDTFLMSVGITADHSITIGSTFDKDKEIFFNNYFSPQTYLNFKIKRISFFNLIINKIIAAKK